MRCIFNRMDQDDDDDEQQDTMTGEAPGASPLSIGQAVSLLQVEYPDITHSSLRFLEREGLVSPQRTPGGHRLFSLQDVDRVRQIKQWQEQRLSLNEIRRRLEWRDAFPVSALAARLTHDFLCGRPTAIPELLQADDLGVPLAVLFQQVLLRTQAEVGRRWQAGDLSVGQEHEITEMVRDAITQLAWRHALEPHGPPILAACAPGEHHDVGLRMVVALLRAQGRRVHFIGSNVDTPLLAEEIRNRQPAVVLLSAMLPERLPALRQLINDLRVDVATRDIPVVVGGGLVQVMEADVTHLGAIPVRETNLAEAVERIVQLVEQHSTRRDAAVVIT